jgi:hypothetical protein
MLWFLTSLVAATLALVVTDDQMEGFSWSFSVPNVVALSAIFTTLGLMAWNASKSLRDDP